MDKAGPSGTNSKKINTFGTTKHSETKSKSSSKNTLINFVIYVERCEHNLQRENHLARLTYLREGLKIIKQTDWQFDPVDQLIGQSR